MTKNNKKITLTQEELDKLVASKIEEQKVGTPSENEVKEIKLVTNDELEKIVKGLKDNERGFISSYEGRRKLLYTLLIKGAKSISRREINGVKIAGFVIEDKLIKKLATNNFSGVVVDEAISELVKRKVIKL